MKRAQKEKVWEFANFLVNNPSPKRITSTVIERATDSAERIVRRDLGLNNFHQTLKPSFASPEIEETHKFYNRQK